ncbi:hypothetical protein ES703_76674 [subsurface metagenome]
MDLSVTAQNVFYFIGRHGIRAASERDDLHQLGIIFFCHPLCRGVEAVGICPLGKHINIGKRLCLNTGKSIFGDDIHAHIGKEIGETMIDQGVYVIGTACHDYQHPTGFFCLIYQSGRPVCKLFLELPVRGQTFFHRPGDGGIIKPELFEEDVKLPFQQSRFTESYGGAVKGNTVSLFRINCAF